MKADYTRFTFKAKKHYRSVRMQQGRVQLDADWNEQMDISAHRVETETIDSVGHCGAPMHRPGFHIVKNAGGLTTEEQKLPENKITGPAISGGDFYISSGHYYVGGILCENEKIVSFSKQPDVPLDELLNSLPPNFPGKKEILKEIRPPKQSGTFLAYIDVWSRHITALEDKEIREVALGGPDTATRAKTVWQVKILHVGERNVDVNCLSSMKDWDELVKGPDGKLAARTEVKEEEDKPCIITPGAGYRRLENQLYRVEVHKGGKLGQATFKWSRDNGTVVAKWTDKDGDKLTVSSTGRDNVLNFAGGQWVELTDDTRELLGQPGTLVKLKYVEKEGNILTIDATTATGSVELSEFPSNPKVCRWETRPGEPAELTPKPGDKFIDLEDGVQVKFSGGTYRTGAYWLIPARTATADVEWPVDDGGNPELQLPHGICHHYCRLAILRFDGLQWTDISDCRRIFPPVTELTSLLYVSGDGQEAMPANELDWPLRVRVVNGQHPVIGAKIKFSVKQGGGTLSVSEAIETAPVDGIAECKWTLGSEGKQQVKAELLDAAGDHIPGQIIYFNADLSTAKEVAYVVPDCDAQYGESEPTVHSLLALSGNWPDIDQDGHSTVKDILDALLCKLDAAKIPFEVPNCSNSIFEAKRQTVADALLSLCNMEFLVGCAITIGSKEHPGKYNSIQQALDNEKGDDICLCLMPGEHIIEKLDEKGRNSIKIAGFGANIYVKGACASLTAKNVILFGAKFYMGDENASMVLGGENVTAERCEFSMKIKNKDSAPLMTITPLEGTQATVNLRWESNKMEAWWIETIPQKVSEVLMPVADIEYSGAARDRLVKLSLLNPYEDKQTFEAGIEEIAKDIEKLPAASRAEWFQRRSMRRISKLPDEQKTAIVSLFNVIKNDRFTPRVKTLLRQNLADAFKSFYVFCYTDAIALAKGVGGWMEDNIINGYVSLQYSGSESSHLRWATGTSDEEIAKINSNKEKWVDVVMKGEDYILVQNTSVNLRGNDFYAVRSNAPFLMKIIESILNSGEGVLEGLDSAYKSLTVTDNIFHSNGNSFVSETIIMQGNKFMGGTQEWSVAANTVGHIGIFTGNMAPQPNRRAIVDCILRADPPEAANFLRIENFP